MRKAYALVLCERLNDPLYLSLSPSVSQLSLVVKCLSSMMLAHTLILVHARWPGEVPITTCAQETTTSRTGARRAKWLSVNQVSPLDVLDGTEAPSAWTGVCVWCVWVSKWVSGWMSEWVSGWVGEWVSGWVSEWVSEWVSKWVKWVSGWMSEWVGEWVGEWVSRC